MSNNPSNIHSSSDGIIIFHRKNSLPALIQQIKPYEDFSFRKNSDSQAQETVLIIIY